MATVTASAPPCVDPTPVAAGPAPSVPPIVAPAPQEKGLWTDWAAMVFWTVCFGAMALFHLKDLIVSLLR